jgi:hypothetical protein
MEQGSDALIEDFKIVEKSYTSDLLSLTIAAGYLSRMLQNARIERHLLKLHPDILKAIQEILAAVNEDRVSASSKELLTNEHGESSSIELAKENLAHKEDGSSQFPALDLPATEADTPKTLNSVEVAKIPAA